ncbi:MAG: hypothetical protein N2321_01875 [Melioribacteraceae bacterium]|nr:hypothetical protein [Melioribacteraceae bacterium]
MTSKIIVRISLLTILFVIQFSSQLYCQNKLKGIWSGTLTISEFSNNKWRSNNASGFIEIDFEKLTANYNVIGFGRKEFSLKVIENKNLSENKIIIHLPEFGLDETILTIKRGDNDNIYASGTTKSAPPFVSAELTIKKVK